MSIKPEKCPHCGKQIEKYLNPSPTVDIIIEMENGGIVLIKRKNPPFGWALPGGFVDYGESLEEAVKREAKEETGLDIENVLQFRSYSDPDRDPRFHTISAIFVARGKGKLEPRDDAQKAEVFKEGHLPMELAFDHEIILRDYFKARPQGFAGGVRSHKWPG